LSDFVFTIAVPLLLVSHHRHGNIRSRGALGALGDLFHGRCFVTWTFGASGDPVGLSAGMRARAWWRGDGGVFQPGASRHSVHQSGVYGEAGLVVLSQLVTIHLPVMMAASIILYQVGAEA
jgi:malonate transporter